MASVGQVMVTSGFRDTFCDRKQPLCGGKPSLMRVALIALHFGEYGLRLANALSSHHEVLFIAGAEGLRRELGADWMKLCSSSCRIVPLEHERNPVLFWRAFREISGCLHSFRPDVIHIQEFSRDYLAFAYPQIAKYTHVATVHDPMPHLGRDAKRRKFSRHRVYDSWLRKSADALIVHGAVLKDQLEAVSRPRGEIFAVPHGPLGDLESPWSDGWVPGTVLFFGRVEEYKGLPVFMQAVELLRREGMTVRPIVAGSGDALEALRVPLRDSGFTVIQALLLGM